MAKPFQALLFRGYAIATITAHAPGQHMWPSPGPGPNSKCSNTVPNHTVEVRRSY